jgi:hypothetical protein
MTEEDDRLVRCFVAVFPHLTLEKIGAARAGGIEEWDSLAALRLAAVLEETFSLRIDLQDLSELGSFAAVEDYLRRRGIGL